MFGCKNFPPELGFFGGRFTGHVVVVVIYLFMVIYTRRLGARMQIVLYRRLERGKSELRLICNEILRCE